MLQRYRRQYREENFVTPPSTSDDDQYEEISTTYNSCDEETESFSSGMTVDSSSSSTEREEEDNAHVNDIIGLDCTEEIAKEFITIVNYCTSRHLPLRYLNDFPMGTRVVKKMAPFGNGNVLKDRVFSVCNQIVTPDKRQLMMLIVSDGETGQQYCLDKPFLLDWEKV
jgi:hypothetical protein